MFKLLAQSSGLRKRGGKLLSSSGLLDILRKFGETRIVGSYAANLMVQGDIDIHVIRQKPFSKKDALLLFNAAVKRTKFNSYYIGDWNNTNIHLEFPKGYYIGFKKQHLGQKWKIDVWLLSRAEQARFDRRDLNISKANLSTVQRQAILRLKAYCNKNRCKMPSQKIYEMVLNKKLSAIKDLKKILKQNKGN